MFQAAVTSNIRVANQELGNTTKDSEIKHIDFQAKGSEHSEESTNNATPSHRSASCKKAKSSIPASESKGINIVRSRGNRGSQIHPEAPLVVRPAVKNHGQMVSWSKDRLVNPTGTLHNYWDLIIVVALLFTATVTPFEVAFLETDINGLFWINRVVDIVFITDIVMNFITPIQVHGNWVGTHREIAKHYVKSWLVLDVVSILPFEIVGFLSDNETVERFRILRVVRLLRLAKLLRIFRASRILKRWEARMSMNYSLLTLIKYMTGMLALAHWLACIFRMVPDYERDTTLDSYNSSSLFAYHQSNWVSNYFVDTLQLQPHEFDEFSEYVAALYWAVMTVTTIGYGDIVAKTDLERLVCVLAMMIGGSMYAYIVGAVCGIVAGMDELTGKFHRTIDDLNRFMDDNNMPDPLKIRLREFFYNTQHLQRARHFNNLMNDMSPDLRGEVSLLLNKDFLVRVPLVIQAHPDEEHEFITAIATHLTHIAYPPNEHIMRPGQTANELCIIKRGVVMLRKSSFLPPELGDLGEEATVKIQSILASINQEILAQGHVFGNDMILTDTRRRYSVDSLTFTEVFTLSKTALSKVFAENYFPKTAKNLRKYAVKLAFKIKFVHVARIIYAKKRAGSVSDQQNRTDNGICEADTDEKLALTTRKLPAISVANKGDGQNTIEAQMSMLLAMMTRTDQRLSMIEKAMRTKDL